MSRPEGVKDFNETEKVFCEVLTNLAKKTTNKECGAAAVRALSNIVASVIEAQKTHPGLCTDRVFSFCMAWLAGAISTADSEEPRKATRSNGLSVMHCGIAFFTGAVIAALLT